ncbi:hypothetical protein KZ813_10575 [Sphingomonas sp. RHCKR7]|nr:hypothetical protein [Sphingomonas folli]MBW6527284.1 hypothetical protein [Sphingomonas folli]
MTRSSPVEALPLVRGYSYDFSAYGKNKLRDQPDNVTGLAVSANIAALA